MSNPATHVFTYGSLMFPDIWMRIVSGKYLSMPAILADHARYAIADETYPGMVPAGGAAVQGRVYLDVAPHDLAALDAFEGADYRRDKVTVVADTGERLSAATYLYLPVARLTGAAWEPESFPLQRFLDTYCRARLPA